MPENIPVDQLANDQLNLYGLYISFQYAARNGEEVLPLLKDVFFER